MKDKTSTGALFTFGERGETLRRAALTAANVPLVLARAPPPPASQARLLQIVNSGLRPRAQAKPESGARASHSYMFGDKARTKTHLK